MENSISQSPILREIWEQGWQNGLTQVAMNMLQARIDPSQVAKLTGLSIDRVNLIHQSVTSVEQSSLVAADWQKLSESSLVEGWLNEEEDRAWRDL